MSHSSRTENENVSPHVDGGLAYGYGWLLLFKRPKSCTFLFIYIWNVFSLLLFGKLYMFQFSDFCFHLVFPERTAALTNQILMDKLLKLDWEWQNIYYSLGLFSFLFFYLQWYSTAKHEINKTRVLGGGIRIAKGASCSKYKIVQQYLRIKTEKK